MLDQSVAENGTVVFGASLTTRIFPLLTSGFQELSNRLRLRRVEWPNPNHSITGTTND